MSERQDETTVASRRQFLGKAAATAVAATAIPSVLAACGESATASEATHQPVSNGLRASLNGGRDPGVTLHKMVAGTIGSAPDVKIPALEKGGTTKYLQRIITDNSRVGTGLATVCKKTYSFSDGTTVTVSVQDSNGRAYAPRTVNKNSDLAYAMKDALSTNPLVDGVLKSSLNAGSAVVALSKSSIVAFQDSVASDFYGNHLDIVSRGFSDLFNTTVSGITIASTTRDLNRC
ncbi:MAG TPA: twin-arginine translocation signal domain-containing protein [Longimicrobium sp.]